MILICKNTSVLFFAALQRLLGSLREKTGMKPQKNMMKTKIVAASLLAALASLLTACQQPAAKPQAELSRAVMETSHISLLSSRQTLSPQALVERLTVQNVANKNYADALNRMNQDLSNAAEGVSINTTARGRTWVFGGEYRF